MQYFPIAIDVLHIRKESKIPRHFLKNEIYKFYVKIFLAIFTDLGYQN